MNIRIEIGNPATGEWEFGGKIPLQPFDEIFSRNNPHLPPAVGFRNQFAIEDFEIDIHGQSQVAVNAHHDSVQGSISIFVKHNGQTFVQLNGSAINSGGQGMSLMFNAPGTTIPVNLTCQR